MVGMSRLMRPSAAQAAPQGHLDELTALDWLDGRLPSDERAEAEAHVDGCPECRHLLAAIARAVDDVDSEPSPNVVGPRATPTVVVGDRIGPYRVREVLGSGAMGVVVRAEDPRLHRAVAIKLVHHPDVSESRVRREARTLARLSHPNVVTVLASGNSDFGPWIAMELVDGWTLGTWVEQTRPSIDARARALRAAATGLRAVHAAGIVHGDFKPGNVLVGRDGRVRVADFGLASVRSTRAAASLQGLVADLPLDASTTIAGHGGTPIYMAPEALRGGSPTYASDQFSFCVTAWELLAGARPFDVTRVGALLQAIDEGPTLRQPGAEQIPTVWRAVLRRGLSGDPAARFETMDALLSALGRDATRSRSGWWLGIGAGVVALALALWPSDRCARVGDPATWLQGVAQPLLDAESQAQWSSWIDAWIAARAGACRSDRASQATCLDTTLAHAEGRLGAVADGAIEPAELVDGLDPIEDCQERPSQDSPSSPEARRLLREIQVTRGRYGGRSSKESCQAFLQLARRADALDDPRLRAKAYYSLALHRSRLGHGTAAREAHDIAYFAAVEADDPDLIVQTAMSLASIHAYSFTNLEEAERWVEHARAALPRTTDSSHRVRLEMVHGEMLMTFGRLDEAEQHMQRSLAAIEDDTPARLRASVQSTLGSLYAYREDFEPALVHFAKAARIHEERGIRGDRDLPRALNGLAVVYARLGRYEEARDAWERMRVLVTDRGLASEAAQLDLNVGALLSIQGDNAGALEYFEVACKRLIEVYGHLGDEVSSCHDNLSMTLLEEDRPEEAVAAARIAIEAALSGETRLPKMALRPLYTLGQALIALGDHSGGIAALRRRIDLREELDPSTPGYAVEHANDRLNLGEALLGAGRDAAARAELERARTEIEALPPGEDREELQADLAELLGE